MVKCKKPEEMSRRKALGQLSAASLMVATAGCSDQERKRTNDQTLGVGGGADNGLNLAAKGAKADRFIIVLTCFGGGSILDSFLALSESQVRAAGGDPSRLNCFSDQQLGAVEGLPFSAVKVNHRIGTLGGYEVNTDQTNFVRKHGRDLMVVTTEGTSVNHAIAQRRSVTGNDAWLGRTVQEAVAMQYGEKLPIPNLNMGSGGFAFPGIDSSLPEYARQVSVADPLYWPLGLDSTIGRDGVPRRGLLALTRQFRAQRLEKVTNFYQTFKGANSIQRWLKFRDKESRRFEDLGLAQKLYFLEDDGDSEKQMLRQQFPNFVRDNLDAQAIMAYLAITRGLSCAVTLGPDTAASASEAGVTDFYNPPIAFDFSHTDHRGTQAMMWSRVLSVADRLIGLLKGKEYSSGQSYWDRTLLYLASDFGRDKVRPSDAQTFSSGHHLNNAAVVISPFANGGKILGGVDAATGLTYGFDLNSGRPELARSTSEKEFYAGLLNTMGVDVSGARLPNVTAMKR